MSSRTAVRVRALIWSVSWANGDQSRRRWRELKADVLAQAEAQYFGALWRELRTVAGVARAAGVERLQARHYLTKHGIAVPDGRMPGGRKGPLVTAKKGAKR